MSGKKYGSVGPSPDWLEAGLVPSQSERGFVTLATQIYRVYLDTQRIDDLPHPPGVWGNGLKGKLVFEPLCVRHKSRNLGFSWKSFPSTNSTLWFCRINNLEVVEGKLELIQRSNLSNRSNVPTRWTSIFDDT